MSLKIDVSGLLPIKLTKLADRSVQGVLPDGMVVTWPADYSSKPTKNTKRVTVNCCYWAPVWVELDALPSQEALASQRLEVAQAAFERYDFFGSSVDDADGWDTSDELDYTRMAHTDAGRINLHVRFEALTATVTSVEAYDMQTGDLIGSLSTDLPLAQPTNSIAQGFSMNIIFSYGADEDIRLDAAGFKFLGAGQDASGQEVHVFQLLSLADASLPNGDEKLEELTVKAQALVNHALSDRYSKPVLAPIPAIEVVDRFIDAVASIRGAEQRHVFGAALEQLVCIKQVHTALDGQEHDSDTPVVIEQMLREVGFNIRDIDEMEEEEDSQN